MKANKLRLIGIASLAACLFIQTSCTRNFEKINKSPLNPDKEMEQLDGILNGIYIPALQKNVIPVGGPSDGTNYVNKYQIVINLAGDSWAGYHSPRDNKFNAGQSFMTAFFIQSWVNNTFSWRTVDVFAPWIQLKNINMTGANPNKEMFALAQIAKVAAMHQTTDMFGPIPYSKASSGSFKVEYDSQEEVYKTFFKELDESIDVLTDYLTKGNTVVPNASDIVYEGDVHRWIKFANSLMLRLAIRVRFADNALAKTYAEKAAKHSIGLIENVDQSAKMARGANLQMRNSLKVINDEYDDTRMGATIQCYLKGYNDPRTSVYFQNSGSKAVRASIPETQNLYNGASKPMVGEYDATYWMKASEVLFLKAEAILAGYDMGGGTSKQFYEDGIKMSFTENNVSIGSYLSSTLQPAAYTDPVTPPKYSTAAPSSVTVAWSDSDNEEKKLEKIITQKYLAIYPNGQEAWSEWRRTGYPRQVPPAVNFTNAAVVTSDGYKNGVRRMPYPRTEYDQNGENLQNAIQKYLGGADNAATNLWWDKKAKN